MYEYPMTRDDNFFACKRDQATNWTPRRRRQLRPHFSPETTTSHFQAHISHWTTRGEGKRTEFFYLTSDKLRLTQSDIQTLLVRSTFNNVKNSRPAYGSQQRL